MLVICVRRIFFPKFTALLVAIPAPVAAAYITVLIALLFVQGMKIVIQDGIDHRKAAVAGVSFWLGTGFQNGWIFPDLLGDGFLSVLLGNGMTSGAMVAVGMTAFLELTGPRRKRLRAVLDMETLPKLMEFLRGFASNAKWDDASTKRLVLVGEETLTSLIAEAGDELDKDAPRRLVVSARAAGGGAELEFLSVAGEVNLEDHLAFMGNNPEITDSREISFRLLRHYASSVHHQKYHGADIVTVQVDGPK